MDDVRGRWVRTGWGHAVLGALIAAGVGLAISEIAAFGFALAGGPAGSAVATARAGALLFYAFHHVPLEFEATLRALGPSRSGHVVVGLAAAPMLGTLVVGGALFVSGRSLARAALRPNRTAGTSSLRVACAHGAKVAAPYALVCAVGVPLARITVDPSGTAQALFAGSFTVGPSFPGAVLWPLILAGVAGCLGGLSAATGSLARPSNTGGFGSSAPATEPPVGGLGPHGRLALGAIAGGNLMAALATTMSFVGLLVLAAIDTHATGAYFDGAFSRGEARGVAVLGLTALEVPNMAVWVLDPAMGSCVALSRSSAAPSAAPSAGACVLSYGSWPSRSLFETPAEITRLVAVGSVAGRGPPAPYLAFLLVPAVAVLAGGWAAARRSLAEGSGGAGRAASAGALAGVVFGGWVLMLSEWSRVVVTIGGAGATGVGGAAALAVGPAIVLSVAVAIAWGCVGGAAGGVMAVAISRKATPARERVFPEPQPPPADASGRGG